MCIYFMFTVYTNQLKTGTAFLLHGIPAEGSLPLCLGQRQAPIARSSARASSPSWTSRWVVAIRSAAAVSELHCKKSHEKFERWLPSQE